MLVEGQSTTTFNFLYPLFILFIIFAVAIASSSFSFVLDSPLPSISIGDTLIISKVSACAFIFSTKKSLLFGVNFFESVTPNFLNSFSVFSSIKQPAKTIGPITGPLPASSIPSLNMGFEKKGGIKRLCSKSLGI